MFTKTSLIPLNIANSGSKSKSRTPYTIFPFFFNTSREMTTF